MVLSGLGSPDTFSGNTHTHSSVLDSRSFTDRQPIRSVPTLTSLPPRSVSEESGAPSRREPSVLGSPFSVHADFLLSTASVREAAATHPRRGSASPVAGRRQSKTRQKRASAWKNEVAGSICGPCLPSLSWRERGTVGQDPAEWPWADSSRPVCD